MSRALIRKPAYSRVKRAYGPYRRLGSSSRPYPWNNRPFRTGNPLYRAMGAPAYQIVTMKYSEPFTAAPGSSTSDGFTYTANGCYDPRTSAGGHQPQGFDQWMVLYTAGIVMSVDFEFDVVMETLSPPSAITPGAIAFIAPFGTSTLPSSATADMMEYPGAIYAPVSTAQNARLKMHIDLPAYFGITAAQHQANNDFWFTASANPVTNLGVQVGCGGLSGGAPNGLNCIVCINYKVKLFNPRLNTTS